MVVYIYALRHPDTKRVAYVGQSANPARRLRQHWTDPVSPAMAAWFGRLAIEGQAPELIVLAGCPEEDGGNLEARYIALYRRAGHPLINVLGAKSPPLPLHVSRGGGFYEDAAGVWVVADLAARHLGVSLSRLRQLRLAGRFPGARQHGRDWFFRQSDLAAYKRPSVGRPRRAVA